MAKGVKSTTKSTRRNGKPGPLPPRPAVDGPDLGGHVHGTVQRKLRAAARLIDYHFEDRGTHIIKEMVDMAMDSPDHSVRSKLLLGMARFIYPHLQSVTVKNEDAPATAFVLNLGGESVTIQAKDKAKPIIDVTPETHSEPQP